MKKLSLITLFAFLPSVATLSSSVAIASAKESVELKANAETDIPPELLDVDQNTHCLRGFAPGVTVDQIRNAGYTTLVIPNDVTSIADYAFAYMFDGLSTYVDKLVLNSSLASIGIGSFTCCYGLKCEFNLGQTNVTSIGHDAFFYCTGLYGQLNLPSTLKTIGDNAFKFCEHLTGTLKFHTGIEFVGSHAFEKCIRMEKIDFSLYDKIPSWLCQQNSIFFELGKKLTENKEVTFNVGFNDESEWEAILKDRQKVDYDSFTIKSLRATTEDDFTYSDSSKTEIIGFNKSTNVDVIKIPDNVVVIKAEAFKDINTSNKYKLVLNENLEEIGEKAFYNSSSIIGTVVFDDKLAKLGPSTFEKSGISGKLEFPSNIETIPEKCFLNSKIQSITLTPSIKELGKNCFSCSSIHEIDVSSFKSPTQVRDAWDVQSYDEDEMPFYISGSHAQKGIILIADTQNISDQWVSKFKTLGITDRFATLADRDWAIYVKDRLLKDLPNTVADKAFAIRNNNEIVGLSKAYKSDLDFPKMYGLIKIPDKINTISDNAFSEVVQFKSEKSTDFTDCPDLITPWYLSFNVGLIKIGKNAFKNCTGLTGRLVLPNTITTIDSSAFEGCTELLEVPTMSPSLSYIGDNAFKNTGFSVFKIPSSLKYVGNGAFSSNNIATIDLTSYGTSYHLNWLPTNSSNNQVFNINPVNNKGKIIVQGNTSLWRDELLKYGLNNQWEIVNEEGGN